MKNRALLAVGWLAGLLAFAPRASAQTTQIPTPEGFTVATENAGRVNGARIRVDTDGAIWFLEPFADSIARFKDGVIRRWQIRAGTVASPTGATPVDFQIDGTNIWFIESGQSLIDPGTCAFAKLDTTTGELTEWVVPGTIPANFYRAPDGTVWLPQTSAVLQSFNLDTLEVLNWRSLSTYAYADMVVAPDGAFWLADFGNNRIVRWVPGAETETSWTFYPLANGRLNPAQVGFDENGYLWIAQRSAARIDRFNPATGELVSYGGLSFPIHFEIFQGKIYISTPTTQTSAITVLDPNLAPPTLTQTLTAETLDVRNNPVTIPVKILHSVIVPTDFASAPTPITPTDFNVVYAITGSIGTLTTTFTGSNTYGIAVAGGRVWAGTDANLTSINLQSIGESTDLGVPIATALAGPPDSKIEVSVTVGNRGPDPMTGSALYFFSPGAFTERAAFTLTAGATTLFADAFGNFATPTQLVNGPVRLGATAGGAANLVATVRSARVLPSGGSFGYLLPAATAAASLRPATLTTLFTGNAAGEIPVLAISSLEDANATLTLAAPDGTVRGSHDLDVAKNTSIVYDPAVLFDVDPEAGDVVRVGVNSGSLQACVLVYDTGTIDIAPSLPAAAATTAVIPYVGTSTSESADLVTDLYLSNPGADAPADVTLSYYAIGSSGPPLVATLTLPALASQSISSFLTTLFDISGGQGALVVTATVPVAVAVRIATRTATGDYGTFATAFDGAAGIAGGQSGFAIGLPQTPTRMGDLLLFNSGAAGTVTVTGFRSDGTQAGQVAVPLGSNGAGGLVSVFAALGVPDQAAGRIRVDVSDGMNVFGWAAAIDLVTGDIDISPLQQ